MVNGKVTDAWAKEGTLWIRFKPDEGNIRGNLQFPCPEGLWKRISRARPTSATAPYLARRLVGLSADIAVMGQMSKQARKKSLKERGLWKMRERKFEVKFVEATKDENKMSSYTKVWQAFAGIDGVEKVEELSLSGKRAVFFLIEGKDIAAVLMDIEKLPFVNHIDEAKKVEVR
jgi:hypothetical protein